MRKNLLAKSIATMISGFAMVGGAQAVIVYTPTAPATVTAATVLEVNTDNIGHSLFYPYYTVQGENFTLFSVVNTDVQNGKAIKVRFRGAENSDDVYDITVLLSPGDVWTANIARNAAGIATLITADKSCTLPNNVNSTFVTARLAPYATDAQKAQSTAEGYIEVFNMADIPPTRTAAGGGGVNPLFTAIKHTNGVPPGCASAATNALFNDPADGTAAETAGLSAPTTGLMGSWTIVNGPAASSWSGPATAVEARIAASDVPGFGNIVFFPQNNTPVTLTVARTATADPILRGGVTDNTGVIGNPGATAPVQALSFDFPDMSTPYLNGDSAAAANGAAARRQAYRLSRALAVSSISNEFVTGSGILATTDWTLSSPTRRYNVARSYGASPAAAANLFTNLGWDDANAAVGTVTVPPNATVNVTNYYTGANTTVSTTSTQPYGVICVTGNTFAAGTTVPTAGNPDNLISGQTTDREEGFAVANNQFVISPGTPTIQRSLCGEVSVLSFNAAAPATSTLNAQLTRFDLTSVNAVGWARIATPGLAVAAGQGLGASTRNGLPIVGSSFVQFTNNNAAAGGANARTVGNYDQTITHRATRY
ncbi:MAG: hypothetical protein JWQ13_4309 [Ramlibacter sp.]|jgi:hypothetical protein|nr:hypothetical protein [Ramlibacter sp.]